MDATAGHILIDGGLPESAPLIEAAVKTLGFKVEDVKILLTTQAHFVHVGSLAANVMGHNIVIAREADMGGINADGIAVAPEHLKPGDARVIAHTRMIGGGESASVTFDVAKVKEGGPYKYFCSFPGHAALMQGNLQVQ